MHFKRKKYLAILIGALAIVFYACHTFDPEPPIGIFFDLKVKTSEVLAVTASSASSGGIVEINSEVDVTARGVVWGVEPGPSVTSNQGITSDGVGIGAWESNLSGLSPNTLYYARAYITTYLGTWYGNQQSFTTLNGAALLTTTPVSKVTQTSANSGGSITSDGGAPVITRGAVWSSTQSPTLETNLGTVSSGSGLGEFSATATGLDPETTYYLRAYATNGFGTQYGQQVSFTTLSQGEAGTVTDVNGNVYRTVTIGSQEWMAENLRVKNYNNGDPILTNVINSDWGNLTQGAFAIYPHNGLDGLGSDEEVLNAYGALYNWYAVDDSRGLCPTGWHVPTEAEWTTLTDYIGGAGVAGGKLKSTNTAPNAHPRWESPNTDAADGFGFSALPGGARDYGYGYFYDVGNHGFWWSSTEEDATNAWLRYIYYDYGNADRNNFNKKNGFSVRCVWDN